MSSFNIIVTHVIKQEKKGYFGHCPEFDVCSQGETIEEAEANLKEAVILYLETIEQLGIREDVFKKRKIVLHRQKFKVKNKRPIKLITNKRKASFITTQSIPYC